MIIINITKNLANTNKNTDGIFSSVDCGEFYRQTFLSLYPSVNTDRNILSVYTEGIEVGKEGIKKNQKNTMTCNFTNFTNGINSTVKFIRKYTNKNNPSIYTDGIMNDITVRFKKANRTVM